MRPIRLEVCGFSTFRHQTSVDFTGAEFFALVGPTGAGKSSLIDAIIFALYGSIPRLDNRRAVAPVVTQGELEARVRLDFSLADVEYTVVRVVRIDAKGRASTKEARLESGGASRAGDADAVSAEVERLLGLSFEQFTTCVVLPQGDFAKFLHETPAHRQDLLVKLLDLGLYERMAARAKQLADVAGGRAEVLRRRLDDDLAYATTDEIQTCRARVQSLTGLLDMIEQAQPSLDDFRDRIARAKDEEERARDRANALASVAVPASVTAEAEAMRAAESARERLDTASAAAERDLTTAQQSRDALPDRAPLDQALEAHKQRGDCERELSAARRAHTEAQGMAQAADASLVSALSVLEQAESAVNATRLAHRAHELASELIAGEPCPVCEQSVASLPRSVAPPDLTNAERARETARAERDRCDKALRVAQRSVDQIEANQTALLRQKEALDQRLAGHPDAAFLTENVRAIEESDRALAKARAEAARARTSVNEAIGHVARLKESMTEAHEAFDRLRDTLSDLAPPVPARRDLADDWGALATWAAGRAAGLLTSALEAATRGSAAGDARMSLVSTIRGACETAGVRIGETGPRDSCRDDRIRAETALTKVELAFEEAERTRKEFAGLLEDAAVAKSLAGQLGARAFEAWMLDEAVGTLLEGAATILQSLTAGQYSLALDANRNFIVTDHHNADVQRSARTLSGGETFLASLALALALADRIADLAATTAVRLESIFLDEGFGTLDPETLDVVASAIENLGASGRMVGLVTHVRDLADRVPVRFEVRKGASTSTVERVDV